jgi:hypothetical protein
MRKCKIFSGVMLGVFLLLVAPATALAEDWHTYTASKALSGGAMAESFVLPYNAKLCWVTLHSNVAITETITITHNSVTGSNYDTVLKTYSMAATSNYFWAPDSSPIYLKKGSSIDVAVTNAGGVGAVYLTLFFEIVGGQ